MLAETREIQLMLATLDHNVSLLLQEAENKHQEDKKRIAELEAELDKYKNKSSE